jgi:hypothetical protein
MVGDHFASLLEIGSIFGTWNFIISEEDKGGVFLRQWNITNAP